MTLDNIGASVDQLKYMLMKRYIATFNAMTAILTKQVHVVQENYAGQYWRKYRSVKVHAHEALYRHFQRHDRHPNQLSNS
jgi:hypothetical protein